MYRSTDIQLSICNTRLYHNHMSVAECRLLQVRFISANVSELISLVRSVLVCIIPVPCVWNHCEFTGIYTPSTRKWWTCKRKPNSFYTILRTCMHVLYLVFSSLLQYAGVHINMLHLDKEDGWIWRAKCPFNTEYRLWVRSLKSALKLPVFTIECCLCM